MQNVHPRTNMISTHVQQPMKSQTKAYLPVLKGLFYASFKQNFRECFRRLSIRKKKEVDSTKVCCNSYDLILFYFISFHFILFRLISLDFIPFSCHFISFHFIPFSFQSIFISFHFISFHFISFHFISFHFISFHFISFHFISFHFISFHFISFHFISFHFILPLVIRHTNSFYAVKLTFIRV